LGDIGSDGKIVFVKRDVNVIDWIKLAQVRYSFGFL